jgi:hypothetical protein
MSFTTITIEILMEAPRKQNSAMPAQTNQPSFPRKQESSFSSALRGFPCLFRPGANDDREYSTASTKRKIAEMALFENGIKQCC